MMQTAWRRRRLIRARQCLLAVVLVVLLTGGLVGRTTAAFTAQAVNTTSTFATATLATPGSVAATLQANGGTVRLTWTATSSAWASGHRVYRATTAGGPYTQVAQLATRTTLSYDDVPGSGTYYYQVRAYYSANGANWESQQNTQAGPIKPLDHFTFDPIGTQISGVPFTITITARASDGTRVTAFSQSVSLSVVSGTISPTTSATFSNGVLTQSVTLTVLGVISNQAITASGGSPRATGRSNTFAVLL